MFYVPGGYPYQVSEYDRCYPPGPVIDPIPMPLPRLSKRRIPGYWGYWNDDGVDFFSFIQVGVLLASVILSSAGPGNLSWTSIDQVHITVSAE